MVASRRTQGTSRAAIFARLWETKDGKLPRGLARHIVKLGFSSEDQVRMRQLAEKNQAGSISAVELEELDGFIQAGDFLALLQSKARKVLAQQPSGADRRG